MLLAEISYAESDRVIVIVGEFHSIKELPDLCDVEEQKANEAHEKEKACITMDLLYEASYQIEDILYGEYEHKKITFKLADHYGEPDFAEFKMALLFIHITKDGNYLSKYMGFPLFNTVDGDRAMCGIPYKDAEEHIESIIFKKDVVFADMSIYSSEYFLRYYDERYYEVKNNKIVCKAGIRQKKLFEYIKKGIMKNRGYDLN